MSGGLAAAERNGKAGLERGFVVESYLFKRRPAANRRVQRRAGGDGYLQGTGRGAGDAAPAQS